MRKRASGPLGPRPIYPRVSSKSEGGGVLRCYLSNVFPVLLMAEALTKVINEDDTIEDYIINGKRGRAKTKSISASSRTDT